ncbi:MAG: YaeQ family protein [Syntrophobacterales bacterium]|nr:MAG: YaeQ family protein [Syntrophobacterales bacterium]
MALSSKIYRFSLELSDIDRQIYESLQATVARHPSETEERLVARLLAYALLYEPGLEFTKGISAGDEPDLWLKGADGRTLLWVEVGLPDSDRLLKASRHCERVALLTCGNSLLVWEREHLPKLEGVRNLTSITIDQKFIALLVSRLDRNIRWSVTRTEGSLYLTVADETLETHLQVKGEEGTS